MCVCIQSMVDFIILKDKIVKIPQKKNLHSTNFNKNTTYLTIKKKKSHLFVSSRILKQ